MPFTPTHILAVLPLSSRFKLSFTALVIGSMIPDFALFYPILPYEFSHSWIGVFAYCLPVGILVYFLFELAGKMLAIDLSPVWIKHRLNDFRYPQTEYTPIKVLKIAIAIVLGSITHIIWDAFTHEGEWGVNLIPLLSKKVVIGEIALPGYKLFQYGSTIIGLPILGILAWLYLKRYQPKTNNRIFQLPKSLFWIVICSMAIAPVVIALYNWYPMDSFQAFAGDTIKQSIAAEIALFSIYAVLYRLVYSSR